MNRRALLRLFVALPIVGWLFPQRSIPVYTYDWSTTSSTDDPRLPFLLYVEQAPDVYLNGVLVSRRELGPEWWIARCQSGIDGWIETFARDERGGIIIDYAKGEAVRVVRRGVVEVVPKRGTEQSQVDERSCGVVHQTVVSDELRRAIKRERLVETTTAQNKTWRTFEPAWRECQK